ncbi:hypothetical protein HN587_03115 [Candidatus Woesearchaeota archaeon]|nr:hypothetical protein [Candidatus Woesearchaeota archaeon]
MAWKKFMTSMILFVFLVGTFPLAALAEQTNDMTAKPMLSAVNEQGSDRGARLVLGEAKYDKLSSEKRERLKDIKDSKLEKLNDLRQDRFDKVSEFKQDKIEKLTELRQDRLDKISDLKQDKIEKLTELRKDRLDKVSELKSEKIEKLTELRQDRLDKISDLKTSELRKLTELRNERLEKMTEDLSNDELEKLSKIRREKMIELANKDSAKIKAELNKIKLVTMKKADLFRERVLSKEVVDSARERYADAKEEFEKVKKAYDEKKTKWSEFQQNLKDCEGVDSARCDDLREEAFGPAKDYLVSATKQAINYFEKLKAKVESMDDLDEERARSMVEDIDSTLGKLEDLLNRINAANSRDDLNVVAKELRQLWSKVKNQGVSHATEIVHSKLIDLIKRAEYTGDKIEAKISELDEQSEDVEKLEDLLESYFDSLDQAKASYYEAVDLREKANDLLKNGIDSRETKEEFDSILSESKSKFKEARDYLTRSHRILVEIVKLIKSLGADIPLAETEQELESEMIQVIESEVTAEGVSCKDYDYGINIFKPSFVRGDSGKVIGTFKDFCSDNENGIGHVEQGAFVHEYLCENSKVVGMTYECENGCYDGACALPTVSATVTTEFVDLELIGFEPEVEPLPFGKAVPVKIGIKNNGNSKVDGNYNIEIQYCKPDMTGCHIPMSLPGKALYPGEEYYPIAKIQPAESDLFENSFILAVLVDGDDEVLESDEFNNAKREILDVVKEEGFVDLELIGFEPQYEPLKYGQEVEVKIAVKNNGNFGVTEGYNVEIQYCKPDMTSCHIPMSLPGKSIAPGATVTYFATIKPGDNDIVDGSFLLAVIADGDNEVSESNELNNAKREVLDVLFPTATNPGTSSSGSGSSGSSEFEICGDGFDNDGDGYFDCHDSDCSPAAGETYVAGAVCTLETAKPTCCLDHNAKTAVFAESFQFDMCVGAGRYPTVNDDVCEAMADKVGYTYEGELH